MPKSPIRKKRPYNPPAAATAKQAVKVGPKPWVAPLMVGLFLIGLIWIVVFYIAFGGSSDPNIPIMKSLGNWNLVLGFGFIAAGFVVSTKWR